MKHLTALSATLLALAPLRAQEETHEDWIGDFDKAVEVATKEKKDLFVDFTGSDWCGWCIRLHNEVFDHDEFLTEAKKDYILVALDFPQSEEVKAKVPNPARNNELSEKYGIRGYPTILLMTPAGEVFGRTGYRPGGPEEYVKHVHELAETGKSNLVAAREMGERFEKAEGEAKVALVREAAERLSGADEDTIGLETFERITRAAFEIDPKNEQGLKLQAIKALLKAGRADDELRGVAREMDPKNEEGLLEQVVAAQCRAVDSEEALKAAVAAVIELDALGIKDKELAREFYMNCAYWHQRFLDDSAKAKEFAKKALELGVEDEGAKEFLEDILKG